jgi:hypothetical protein
MYSNIICKLRDHKKFCGTCTIRNNVKIIILRDMARCRLADVHGRFGRTYFFHPASVFLFTNYLLSLLFDPENGDSTFLRNIVEHLPEYTASHSGQSTHGRTSDPTWKHCVGFEVLTPVVMESSIFCDITPCNPLKVNRRFRGTCRLHLQYRRISQAKKKNQRERRWQGAGFLLWLILPSWRLRRHVPPKRPLNFNGLHCVISQKKALTRYKCNKLISTHVERDAASGKFNQRQRTALDVGGTKEAGASS